MMSRRWMGSTIALLLLLVLVAWLGGAAFDRRETVRVARVAEAVAELSLEGVVRPRSAESYFSPIQGMAAKVLDLVPDGTPVREGDLLARIDSYGLEEKRIAKQLELREKTAQLATQRRRLDQLEIEARGTIRSLEAQLEQAREAARSYRELEAPLAVFEARKAVATAEADVRQKEEKLSDLQEFLQKGYASRAEVDRARRDLEVARDALEVARRRLDVLERVEVPRTQEQLDQAIVDLEEKIEQERIRIDVARKETRAQIDALAAEIENLRRTVRQLEEQIAGCEVRARGPGIAVRGTVFDKGTGHRKVEVGDLVWSNVVLVRVTDISHVDMEVRVPEAEMRQLSAGAPAEIRLLAEPLAVLLGRVREIGTVSRRGIGTGGAEVTLRVEIEDPPAWIRPGMGGRVRIRTATYRDGIVVPFSAVCMDEEGAYVVRPGLLGDSVRRVAIRGEVEDGVVLRDGIEAGDRILLVAPCGD